MIALRGLVLFPYMLMHFDVGRDFSVAALNQAKTQDELIFLVAQKDDRSEALSADAVYTVGVIANIKQTLSLPNGNQRVFVEGISRGEILRFLKTSPYIVAEIQEYDEAAEPDDLEYQALLRRCRECFREYITAVQTVSPDTLAEILQMEEAGQFADIVASNLEISVYERQLILECVDVKERLAQLIYILTKELDIAKLSKQIESKVNAQINQQQREYHLREQLKVIQEELGDKDGLSAEIAEYKAKMGELDLPEEVSAKCLKELDRLQKTPPGMGEGGVIRTYLDTVLALPWNKYTDDNISLSRAEKTLNDDHYGLEKVKTRILEYMAVHVLTGNIQGSILCLAGPPGVGKTSIAKSIARSMNRNYARISLGGVRDEADIRGHRKTYIGAMPGRIMEALRESGSANPLILLDEIDKMGNDYRGDPAAALLEVLDGEQNFSYRDHYIELPFDLSRVLFLTTANTLDTVPRPLLDRMEVIELPGYTDEEKLQIAERYLLPKQLQKHGLKKSCLRLSAGVLPLVIEGYTREAGVRGLERQISALCRKTAKLVVSGEKKRVSVTPANLSEFLGARIFSYDPALEEDVVGVARGLAWTSVGGDTLQIEVNVMDGSGKLELTGSLGDVMKESAHAAVSYIRSKAAQLEIDPSFYRTADIHVHVPEGATPKDGPSAGITIATAIISALTGYGVRHEVAMTGEITLRGRVLPIGGLKEKSLAAYRAGIKTIIIPKENKKDLEEIPLSVKETVSFVCASDMEQVLRIALAKKQTEDSYRASAERPSCQPPYAVPLSDNPMEHYMRP